MLEQKHWPRLRVDPNTLTGQDSSNHKSITTLTITVHLMYINKLYWKKIKKKYNFNVIFTMDKDFDNEFYKVYSTLR